MPQVTIQYQTTPESSAIQWLEPQQTAGKKDPFLFTQCQAIHARSLVPCQDTPQVKATYDAKVTVPATLVAIMSALGNGDVPETPATGTTATYTFRQPVAMAAYSNSQIITSASIFKSVKNLDVRCVFSQHLHVLGAKHVYARTEF